MKRLFDIIFSVCTFIVALPLFLVICLLIKLTSSGPLFYVSDRIGKDNSIFRMPKFRTMRTDTPQVATHLMENPEDYVTSIGRFLRKTSLDELPQLINVIKGDMSIVGPRPALFNQDDLVALRTEAGVHKLVPGVTGWAQTHGRDEIPIPEKVKLDAYYFEHQSFLLDLKILWLTVVNVMRGRDVSH